MEFEGCKAPSRSRIVDAFFPNGFHPRNRIIKYNAMERTPSFLRLGHLAKVAFKDIEEYFTGVGMGATMEDKYQSKDLVQTRYIPARFITVVDSILARPREVRRQLAETLAVSSERSVRGQ